MSNAIGAEIAGTLQRSPRLFQSEPDKNVTSSDLDMAVVGHIRNRKPGVSGQAR